MKKETGNSNEMSISGENFSNENLSDEMNISLEDIMDKLDQTVQKMEGEKLTLEESYQCFSQGMELVKAGNEAIDRVEKKIQILMEEDSGDEQ